MHVIDVVQCMREAYFTWHRRPLVPDGPVRSIPDQQRTDFKYFIYRKWFSPPDDMQGVSRSYVSFLHRPEQIKILARFRMGAHWLNSECARSDTQHRFVPRSSRVCPCCSFQAREDEMHLLECPFYNDIRLHYPSLFKPRDDLDPEGLMVWSVQADDQTMRSIMNGDTFQFWSTLANFLLACKSKRQTLFPNTLA